jgi:titin
MLSRIIVWGLATVALVGIAAAQPAVAAAGPTRFVVTHSGPTDAGSLAEAMVRASAAPAGASITFALPTTDPGYQHASGTWRLTLAQPLPYLTKGPIHLDARTQPAAPGKAAAGPRIVLAAARPDIEYAITSLSEGNSVRGLAIVGFKTGLVIYGPAAARNTIEGNWIGVDPADKGQGNSTGIVVMEGACDNTLRGNVVSGNAQMGVYVAGSKTLRNRILANHIGCDAAGVRRLPNGVGIVIAKAAQTCIGAPGEGNLISGNDDVGILLVGKGTESNSICGNLIGTDAAGTRVLYNNIGIVIKSLANENLIGGAATGEGNVVSGNIEIGIYIEAADRNRILGSLIGTDITGRKAVVDGDLVQGNGIEFNTVARDNVLGGLAPGERNIISGHKVYGVVYYGHCTRNSTIGNYIGTDITGQTALPNATGICVDCASHHNDITANVISGNMSYGMFFVTRGTDGNRLRGNYIGTNAAGTAALPNDIGMVISTGASGNVVGGDTPEDRNIISGNTQGAIMVTNRFTEANQITGNYIGTDHTGSAAIPNRFGVLFATYPKANVAKANVICGSTDAGVILYEYAESNLILSNRIGVGAGNQALGNGVGVLVGYSAHDNIIGRPGAGNMILHNRSAQYLVQEHAGPGNRAECNTIQTPAQGAEARP